MFSKGKQGKASYCGLENFLSSCCALFKDTSATSRRVQLCVTD